MSSVHKVHGGPSGTAIVEEAATMNIEMSKLVKEHGTTGSRKGQGNINSHVSLHKANRTGTSKLLQRKYMVIAAVVTCVCAVAIFLTVWFLMPKRNYHENIGENFGSNVVQNFSSSVGQNFSQNVDQNVGQDVSQNISQNVRQDVGQNVSQNISQNLGHDVGHNDSHNVSQNVTVGQDVGQNDNQNVSQNVDLNVGQNYAQNVNPNVGRNVSQNVGQNVRQDVSQHGGQYDGQNDGQNVGQNVTVGQDVGKNDNQNVSQNIGQNVYQDVVQNVSQNAGRNGSQNVGRTVDQNVSQNVGQTAGQNVSQNVGQNVSQSVGQNVSQNVGQTVGQNISQNIGQNISQTVDQNVSQNVGLNVSRNVGRDVSQNVGQDVGQTYGQNASQNVGLNVRRNVGQNVSRNFGQNFSQDVGQNFSQNFDHDFGKNVSRNVGQNVSLNAGQNGSQNVGQNASQNVSQKIGQNFSQNFGQNFSKNFDHDFGKNISENVGLNVSQNFSQDVGHDFSKNVSQNVGLNVSQNFSQDVGQNFSRNVDHDFGKNFSQNVGQNASQNVSQNVAQDVGQNISRNVGQNFSQDVGLNVSQNVGQNVSEDFGQNVNGNFSRNVNQYVRQNVSQDVGPDVGQDVDNREGIGFHSFFETAYQSGVISSGAADACVDMGRSILQQGGSAVDAAITISLCAGLHNPETAGIGGGSLMLVFNETSGYGETFDSLSVAPLNSSAYEYLDYATLSRQGGMSAAVPGAVAGYVRAWQDYGRLPWKDLVNPVVSMCQKGVSLSSYTAGNLDRSAETLSQSEAFRDEFFRGGQPLASSAIVHRHRLCKTLEILARDKDSFYTGALAMSILADITDEGGRWVVADLNSYRAVSRGLMKYYSKTGDFLFLTPPAPSFGMVAGQALKYLSGYSFTPSSVSKENSSIESTSLTYHRVIESFKFAFARKNFFGDPAFDPERKQEGLALELKYDEYAERVRERLRDDVTHNHSYFYTLSVETQTWRRRRDADSSASWYKYGADDDSFSSLHTSVADSRGLVVSMTTTLSSKFGSKVMGNRTGIIFNNGMSEFSRVAGHHASPNNIAPGKRAMTFMCPSAVIDEKMKVRLVLGAVGGPKAITATVWTILNFLVFNKTLSDSVLEPRLHNQLFPDLVNYDYPARMPLAALKEDYIRLLERRRHHVVKLQEGRAGYVYAIARRQDGEAWIAAADSPGAFTGY